MPSQKCKWFSQDANPQLPLFPLDADLHPYPLCSQSPWDQGGNSWSKDGHCVNRAARICLSFPSSHTQTTGRTVPCALSSAPAGPIAQANTHQSEQSLHTLPQEPLLFKRNWKELKRRHLSGNCSLSASLPMWMRLQGIHHAHMPLSAQDILAFQATGCV